MAEGDGKTVLVTGGSGYLGGWCVVELLRRGYRVRTTVRNASREPEVRAAVGSQVDAHHDLSVHVADLISDEHWQHVIEGCDYVLHVASPLPESQPKDPDELIIPAREGTLRVLRAALDSGIQRVVLTSSVAAIRGGNEGLVRTLDETVWTDLDAPGLTPYVQSKTIAERAAWDLAAERFIAVTEFLWMAEVAELLRERLGPAASKVPTRVAPDLLVRAMALFDGGIRSFRSSLGKRTDYDAANARERLGWSPRPIEETILDTAESLIDHGVVRVPAGA